MSEAVSGVNSVNTLANLNAYWKEILFFYDASNQIEYICKHHVKGAATTDEKWEVWKFTYSGTLLTRREGPLKGAADDRATLSWA